MDIDQSKFEEEEFGNVEVITPNDDIDKQIEEGRGPHNTPRDIPWSDVPELGKIPVQQDKGKETPPFIPFGISVPDIPLYKKENPHDPKNWN
jgi:hypothetical protein